MKKLVKFLKKAVHNFWVQLLFFSGACVGLVALYNYLNNENGLWANLLELIAGGDFISIFLAGFVSLLVAKTAIKVMQELEESAKLDDDRHKIICKYRGHKKPPMPENRNYFSKDGAVMNLYTVASKHGKVKTPKNNARDKYSPEYKARRNEIDEYMNGRLNLPAVNVFANIAGDTRVSFRDSNKFYTLPSFVTENALALLGAHGGSEIRNNVTVRLNDLDYADGMLVLDTMRTKYFDMLVTNRCMDYKIGDAVTLRELYEFDTKINPLSLSQLSNQTGINGIILTKDGYLLLEKRGRKKAIWKNKFAQPISLAMKENEISLTPDGKIASGHEQAEEVFKKIIFKTIENNYGLGEEDFEEFNLSDSLLGIARDLLEGGKPNIYFYAVSKHRSCEFLKLLESKAKKFADGVTSEILPKLTDDKLESEFYLIKGNEIILDYTYALKVKARHIMRVKRKFAPQVNALKSAFDGSAHRQRKAFNANYKRQCGEALLSCLYFANVCGDRIERHLEINDKL